jgi:hypothetical protein
MEGIKGKHEWYFFLACLCLGIAAEQIIESFNGGVSLIMFLGTFYSVFLLRFRYQAFTNIRLGTLLMICTWILASTYLLYSNSFFQFINIFILSFLVITQLVLITGSRRAIWYHWSFLAIVMKSIGASIIYSKNIISTFVNQSKKGVNEHSYQVIKKIFIGLIISGPILFIVLILLSSADVEFRRIVFNIPGDMFQIEFGEKFIRFVAVIFFTFAFFSLMQVLFHKHVRFEQNIGAQRSFSWDPIIIWTLLISLNAVYLLFTVVQFRYLFTDRLVNGFTYAEYARRGFFELLMVTILNLSILVIVLAYMKHHHIWKKQMTRVLLTFLVTFTGVMLVSSFLRLMMYEGAYGFTFSRVLAHSFMLYLMIVLFYTFLKIWIDRLSLAHFFLLSGLIYYTALNVININQLVVTENLERYNKTGKVDIHYLDSMSYTGWLGLIELYEANPDIPELEKLLKERKLEATIDGIHDVTPWWDWNWSREKAYAKLIKLKI